jgi:hypothetical protein
MKISHRAEDKHVFTLEQADRIDSLIRRALIKGKSLKNIPDAAVLALLESLPPIEDHATIRAIDAAKRRNAVARVNPNVRFVLCPLPSPLTRPLPSLICLHNSSFYYKSQ